MCKGNIFFRDNNNDFDKPCQNQSPISNIATFAKKNEESLLVVEFAYLIKKNNMSKNVKLIYALIQKDLKALGWDDESIAEAIAESQRERHLTGADDNTLCVKEMSYLSQESLQEVVSQMDVKESKSNFFVHAKKWIVSLVKGFLRLN